MVSKRIAYIYLFLCFLLSTKGILLQEGGIIVVVINYLVMAMGLYYFALGLGNRFYRDIWPILAVFILFVIYGIEFWYSGRSYYHYLTESYVPCNSYLLEIFSSFLPIFTVYFFVKKGVINTRFLQISSLVLLASAIIEYFHIVQTKTAMMRGDELGFTVNAAYRFLRLLPLLLVWNKNKIIQLGLLGIIFIFIILSAKRGAILVLLLCAFYYFIYTIGKKFGVKHFALMIGLALVGYWFLDTEFSSNAYLQERMQNTLEGSYSGRDDIYLFFLAYLADNSDLTSILFGKGAFATVGLFGQYAHNDWLEIAVNQGLLGIIFYIVFFIFLFKTYRHLSTNDSQYKPMMGLLLVILFATTFFSMSYSQLGLPVALPLALCLNQANRNRNTFIRK